MNEHLWSKDDGEDHYITQLNHDGTTVVAHPDRFRGAIIDYPRH